MSLVEWHPEVQCPPEVKDFHVVEYVKATDNALREYIRKLEIELLVAPQYQMLEVRDQLIDSNSQLLSDRDSEIRRLKAEVEDLSKIIQNAALTGMVKVEFDVSGALTFTINKAEWKNKIITTLGFADREIYMQFSPDRRLLRVITDVDVKNGIQEPPV